MNAKESPKDGEPVGARSVSVITEAAQGIVQGIAEGIASGLRNLADSVMRLQQENEDLRNLLLAKKSTGRSAYAEAGIDDFSSAVSEHARSYSCWKNEPEGPRRSAYYRETAKAREKVLGIYLAALGSVSEGVES